MKRKIVIKLLIALAVASVMSGCGTAKNDTTEISNASYVAEDKKIVFREIEVPKQNKEKENRKLSYTMISLTKKDKSETDESKVEEPIKTETPKQTEQPKKEESSQKEEQEQIVTPTPTPEPIAEPTPTPEPIEMGSDIVENKDEILTSEKPTRKQEASGDRPELAGFEFYDNGIPMVNGTVGDIGRLMIPEVGYSAALYDGSYQDFSYRQNLVNAYDSADYEYMTEFTSKYVADHNVQGFENMKDSIPGQTIAYIYWADGSYSAYQCVSINLDGTYDDPIKDVYNSGYDLVMQTCNNYVGSVTFTYWNEISL